MSDVLAQPIFAGGEAKPFGELTLADVRGRADELRRATGWGPLARVGPVARAWADLAGAMEAAGAQRVRDLPERDLDGRAVALWVVMS